MAATVATKPMVTLIALAAILAVLAVAATPASASQINFYSGQRCTGLFLGACGDLRCCHVPFGTVSYTFRYVPGYIAYLYKDPSCKGNSQANLTYEVSCTNDVNFRSTIITNQLEKMVASA